MFLTDSKSEAKEKARKETAKHVEEFLARGGKIQEIPVGAITQEVVPYSLNVNGIAKAHPKRKKPAEDEGEDEA